MNLMDIVYPRPGSVRHISQQCDIIAEMSEQFSVAMGREYYRNTMIGDTRIEARDFDLMYYGA